MSDRRYLACVVVLVFLVALLCAPVVSSRMLLRDDSIGQVDTDCMKGGGSQGDDDVWSNGGGGPPADTHEKISDEGRDFEEVRLEDGRVELILPKAILFRIIFARLFVL